jgi:hypothetical protein
MTLERLVFQSVTGPIGLPAADIDPTFSEHPLFFTESLAQAAEVLQRSEFHEPRRIRCNQTADPTFQFIYVAEGWIELD